LDRDLFPGLGPQRLDRADRPRGPGQWRRGCLEDA
jgi:hypothetical protein